MKSITLCFAAAIALSIPAAAAAQDAVQGPDEPMRQIFQTAGAVAFMTAPRPDAEGRLQAWTWLFLKQPIPTGADALALQWEVDCAARTVRTVRTALYQGATHMRTDPAQAPASAPAAGTPGALTLDAACATGRPRTQPLPTLTAARTSAGQLFAAQP